MELKGHINNVRGIAVLPHDYLATCGDDSTVRIWRTSRRLDEHGGVIKRTTLVVLRGHHSKVNCLALLRGCGTFQLASGGNDQSIRFWKLWDAEHAARDWGPDDEEETEIFESSMKKYADTELGSGAESFRLDHHKQVNAMVQLPNRHLAVGGTGRVGNVVRIWDIEKIDRRVAVEGLRPVQQIFEREPQPLDYFKTLEGHRGPINNMVHMHPDTLVTCASDCTVRVWPLDKINFESSSTKRKLKKSSRLGSSKCPGGSRNGHSEAVYGLAISEHGSIVSASMDKTVLAWPAVPRSASTPSSSHAALWYGSVPSGYDVQAAAVPAAASHGVDGASAAASAEAANARRAEAADVHRAQSSSAAGGASPSADASASDNTTTNGLVNLGGTCYVNATVQMILANETVKQAVLRCGNMLSHNAVPQRPNARASSLKWIIFLARTVGTNRLVTETQLDMEGFLRHTSNWGRAWGDRHRHEDAGEFLRTFLEHIEQSVNAVEVEESIIIGNPMASFQLSLEVTTLCLSSANASTCDSRTHCEQDSLILLPLQPKWLPPDWKRVNVLRSGGDDGFVLYDSINSTVSRHPTLVEMLDDFFPTDDEDMRTVCDTCRQQLFQSVRFGSQPPESLLLRVKRSWTSAGGGAQKLRNPIGIPDELDIAPSWYADTIDSTTATRYRISSVVVHVGTPQSGHYTTHVADWHGGDACTWTVRDDMRELSGRFSAHAATDRLRNAAIVSYTKANAPVAADGGVEEAHELALSPTSIGYRSTLDAVRRVALSRTAKPLHDFIDDVVRNIAGWSGSGTTSQRKAIFATMIKLESLHSFVFEHHGSMQLVPTL